jgi:hypothetical protein
MDPLEQIYEVVDKIVYLILKIAYKIKDVLSKIWNRVFG